MDQKHCIKCKTKKPATDFHRLTKSRDDVQTYCEECNIANARGVFDRNKLLDGSQGKGGERILVARFEIKCYSA
jgi:hypothetical protein